MSTVPKETIEVIAQSIGINNLPSDVALALAPDVEYRVREIMQEAIKCMRHSRRVVLTAQDVDSALSLRNVEPLYGFASNDPLRFKRAAGHKDLYYVDDKDLEFKDVIEATLPRAPLDTGVVAHWLAIEGVQPAIPENPPIDVSALADVKKSEYKDDGLRVDIKLPVKHVLTKELQLYFDKVIELITHKSDSALFKAALTSLATDPGLHSLVPYFTYFIADEVSQSLNNHPLLFALMRVVWSLLQNPHIHVEPYLHQMMPSIMTCLVGKRLGSRLSDNHWELRKISADLVGTICRRFGHVYHNLQPRVTRTLLHAFLDPTKALRQHYGAIQGLASLGPNVIQLLILPNLEPYMRLLGPEMLLEAQKNELKRNEAWRVYGALLFAAGRYMHHELKQFQTLPLPPPRVMLKSNVKVATRLTRISNKRKASMDNLAQQPPLQKAATDGPISAMPLNSMQIQGGVGTFPSAVCGSDIGLPSVAQQMQHDNILGGGGSSSRKDKTNDHNKSSILAHTLKEDVDCGRLLATLFEHFGESMFNFTPSSELSMFL